MWVVSVAEVLVCWVVVGGFIRCLGVAGSRSHAILGWLAAAGLFALYHFAHSPPFNTVRMVALLGGVGLVTGGFFFSLGELYGTIVFHNFLGLKGVTQALAESGRLDAAPTPQVWVLITALAVTTALIVADRLWIRRASGRSLSSSKRF